MKRDLLAGRGKVRKLTFFVHDFMDAGRLEQERIDACVFIVATSQGPVSMCRHNAVRDAELLRSLPMRIGFWNPLTGAIEHEPPPRLVVEHSRKTARGRVRARLTACPDAAPVPQCKPAQQRQRGKQQPCQDRHVEHVLAQDGEQDRERQDAEAGRP